MQLKLFVWPILELLARLRQPWLTAQVLRFVTQPLPIPGAPRSEGAPRHRILAPNVNKSGALEDIEETFHGCGTCAVFVWPNYALRAIAAALLSPQLDHNNYLTDDPQVEATKRTYRDFLKGVWKHYRAAMKIDVVLANNFSYCHQREFGAALEELGTPFVALHKENVRPPRRVKEYWAKVYKERRGPFAGRKILVYNQIERDLEISSSVAEPARIEVTGMPRLDRLHRWRRAHAGRASPNDRPQILFFSFSRQNKLTAPGRKRSAEMPKGVHRIDGDWGHLGWDRMWLDAHKAMIDVARANPGFRVVIKLKGQLDKNGELREVLHAGETALPPNLELVAGGDPFGLIVSSHVVVGFNTTGLLEAVAAGKPVIVPRFEEADAEDRRDLIIDLGEAADYAGSREELVRLAVDYASDPPPVPAELPDKAAKILGYWVGNEDGAAGHRVLAAIRREIVHTAA